MWFFSALNTTPSPTHSLSLGFDALHLLERLNPTRDGSSEDNGFEYGGYLSPELQLPRTQKKGHPPINLRLYHFSSPIFLLRGPTLLRPRSFSALSRFTTPT
ncbi:hypothetical protein H9Q70_003848 [Fusarium xylarioides]|nr:hypothetical protein H9Q70_003848 [Fusarium xylarioides]KAG5826696.1 hypothetical protein H9Q74_003235 [Fusarium xylarioides]